MRTSIRIVAGSLRGRKLTINVRPEVRPTPQRVREALFSILGNAVPGRIFADLFAGTGVVGLEALSRGAKQGLFVERDFKQAQEIEQHIRAFNMGRQSKLFRTDVYRWAAAWQPPAEPVNVFLSPPFADLEGRSSDLMDAITGLQDRVADDSLLILQSEHGSAVEGSPEIAGWEYRRYGRNVLLLWQKGAEPGELGDGEEPEADDPDRAEPEDESDESE